jgi:hypothetical protein
MFGWFLNLRHIYKCETTRDPSVEEFVSIIQNQGSSSFFRTDCQVYYWLGRVHCQVPSTCWIVGAEGHRCEASHSSSSAFSHCMHRVLCISLSQDCKFPMLGTDDKHIAAKKLSSVAGLRVSKNEHSSVLSIVIFIMIFWLTVHDLTKWRQVMREDMTTLHVGILLNTHVTTPRK